MNQRRPDYELLQAFARHRDEVAFAALVERHLDLVFGTARRKVEDAEAAEEICQNVFAALASKAWRFAPDDSLPAWLHRAALLEARNWLRGELRRRRREQIAGELGATMRTSDEQTALRALVPVLDEALLALREKDRTALLLRYCENRSLREVGASLGVSEDAAQKRVTAALEKLVQFFQRRGFRTASVAAAAGALQHPAGAAPATLAASIAEVAAATAPPALTGLMAVLAGFAGLTKIQKALVCVVLVAAPGLWRFQEGRAPRTAITDTPEPVAANAPLPQAERTPTQPRPQPDQLQPAPALVEPVTPGIRSVPGAKEYSVHVRGMVDLPDFKAALVGIQHHSFDRSNAPPMVVRRLLREGESFEDRSSRDAYLSFELLQVDILNASVRLREHSMEMVYGLEDAPVAGLRPGGPNLAIWLPNSALDDFVDIYAALVGRTVLCHPRLARVQLSIATPARDRAEAAAIMERELGKRGGRTLSDGDKFALLVPAELAETITTALRNIPRRTFSADEYLPAGAIYLQSVDLDQALPIYGELLGRKPINAGQYRGRIISFRNQTALSRSEALYAFEILLGWQGLQVVVVDSARFRVTQVAGGR